MKSKRYWIISEANRFVVEKNGAVFQYQLLPTQRSGFTGAREAKEVLYHARRALKDDRLVVVAF